MSESKRHTGIALVWIVTGLVGFATAFLLINEVIASARGDELAVTCDINAVVLGLGQAKPVPDLRGHLAGCDPDVLVHARLDVEGRQMVRPRPRLRREALFLGLGDRHRQHRARRHRGADLPELARPVTPGGGTHR